MVLLILALIQDFLIDFYHSFAQKPNLSLPYLLGDILIETKVMNYSIKAEAIAENEGIITIKDSKIDFGTTKNTADTLPSPAELFFGAFSSCILKNVERFSEMMKFCYEKASLSVTAKRLEHPPRMKHLNYELVIYSNDDKLNLKLLQKNIEKFGTIFNTVKQSCSISGEIRKHQID